jgi:alkanesulfonate monooxygenase SsuD/methylene tetrahydromethanopterin reductase-like flavin-dependent oxidoreductase (luciferase family)
LPTEATPFGAASISLGVYAHALPPTAAAENLSAQAWTAVLAGFDGVTVGEHPGRVGVGFAPIWS